MTIEDLHHQALELADIAFYHQSKGDVEKALFYFKDSLELEKEAAYAAKGKKIGQPTQAILFRSAAALAAHASIYETSLILAEEGLLFAPPEEVKAELIEIRDEANIQLELRKNITKAVLGIPEKQKPSQPRGIHLTDLPADIIETINNISVALGGVGFAGSLIGPGADLVVIAPVWVGLTIKLAELTGREISQTTSKKIAIAVLTGSGTFLAGTKLASTALAWATAPFTFGLSFTVSIAAGAALNVAFTKSYGRAVARLFLSDIVIEDLNIVIKMLIALVGEDYGFVTPYDDLIGRTGKK